MIDQLPNARIALAHDWLVGLRGGELVLDRLARLAGAGSEPAKLYTLVSDGRPLTDAIDACDVVTSPLQRLPGAAGRLRRHYLPLMPWAVGRLRVEPCDLLVSTSSAVMKSIRPPAGTPHLCYCHSPARYIWEQGADYERGSGGGVRRLGLRLVRGPFRRWDARTADRVTRFVANSAHTRDRIRRCFDRDADVVHPPVRTEYFSHDATVAREPWLLVVSALEPYKRVDLVIEAARRGGWPVKIAGSGSQLETLRARAGRDVEVLGRVDDETLRDLYRRGRALIFPQQEDFGIVAVEAQATGCPVVAYEAGGAIDSVAADTGVFFGEQTAEAIDDAVHRLDEHAFDPAACRANAERFGEASFDAAMTAIMRELLR